MQAQGTQVLLFVVRHNQAMDELKETYAAAMHNLDQARATLQVTSCLVLACRCIPLALVMTHRITGPIASDAETCSFTHDSAALVSNVSLHQSDVWQAFLQHICCVMNADGGPALQVRHWLVGI